MDQQGGDLACRDVKGFGTAFCPAEDEGPFHDRNEQDAKIGRFSLIETCLDQTRSGGFDPTVEGGLGHKPQLWIDARHLAGESTRARHVTHRGIDEATAFAERFVDEGVQFEIEDIMVNGPPWNNRIALRVQSFVPSDAGTSASYNNRAIALLEIRWGRLVRWEDYEDTERVAARDTARSVNASIA